MIQALQLLSEDKAMSVFPATLDVELVRVLHILNVLIAQLIVIYGFKDHGRLLQQLAISIAREQLTQLEILVGLDSINPQLEESVKAVPTFVVGARMVPIMTTATHALQAII